MLTNTPTTARRLAGTAIAALVAAGGLALSLPASAQDAAPKGEPQKVIKEVRIIETDGPDGKKVVRLEGKDGELKRECPGEVTGVSVDAETGGADAKKKAFIMVCSKPGESKLSAVQGLEKALTRIQSDTDMDPAIKAELSTKLKAKIEAMKAN